MTRGRPRNPDADLAIERATREMLTEVGYSQTSMQGVAERAGVAKTTVYRRAPDKASLVFEVMFGSPPPALGDWGSDWEGALKALVAGLSAEFTDPVGRAAMPGLFAEFSRRPTLAARVRERLLAPAYTVLEALLEEGRASGEINAEFDVTLWMDALFGAVFVRSLIFDRQVGREVTDALVDLALNGVRSPEPRGSTDG